MVRDLFTFYLLVFILQTSILNPQLTGEYSIASFAFIDGCANNQCPSGSTCVNIPGGSVTCRCTRLDHVIVNNKCVAKPGKIINVVGLKFDQTYKDSYKDTNSESFKAKAAEIESVLTIVICNTMVECIAIRVISIRPGSIAVDYSVIIDKNYDNITTANVLEVSKRSLNDERMLLLRVNRSSTLSAQSKYIENISFK